MRIAFVLPLLFASTVSATDCKKSPKCEYSIGYVEETVVVKKPVLIKRTPIIETREKQITVKEQVVTGYKEEVVEAAPVKRKFLGNLFKKNHVVDCASCN
jgi:hypothetical protein